MKEHLYILTRGMARSAFALAVLLCLLIASIAFWPLVVGPILTAAVFLVASYCAGLDE